MVAGIGGLPISQPIYENLIRELKVPDSSLKRVGVLMARDIAMVALSLKSVGSAFLGLSQCVEHFQQVVNRIGLETIKK